jgi:hypothetical protein
MDTFLKSINDVPIIIWEYNNNNLKCIKINKKATDLILTNNNINFNNISLNDLNINKKNKIKKIIKKIRNNYNNNFINKIDCYDNHVWVIKNIIKDNPSIVLRIFKYDYNKICMFFENYIKQSKYIIENIINNIIIAIGFIEISNYDKLKFEIIVANKKFYNIWKDIIQSKIFKDKIISFTKLSNSDLTYDMFFHTYNNMYYCIHCYKSNINTQLLLVIKIINNLSLSDSILNIKNFINNQNDINIYNNIKIQFNSLYNIIDIFNDDNNNNNNNNNQLINDNIDFIKNIKKSSKKIEKLIDNYYYLELIKKDQIKLDINYLDLHNFLNNINNCIKNNNINSKYFINYNVYPFLIGDSIKLKYIFKTIIYFIHKYINIELINIDIENNNIIDNIKINEQNSNSVKSDKLNDKINITNIIFKLYIKQSTINSKKNIRKIKKYLNILCNNNTLSINKNNNINLINSLLISKYFIKLMDGNINYKYINKIIVSNNSDSNSDTNYNKDNIYINNNSNFNKNDIIIWFNIILQKHSNCIDILIQKYYYLFNNKKILIIDSNNNNICHNIINLINKYNFKITICKKINKIIKIINNQTFDVIFINFNIYKNFIIDNSKITNNNIDIICITDNLSKNNIIINQINTNFNLKYLIENNINEIQLFNILFDSLNNKINIKQIENNKCQLINNILIIEKNKFYYQMWQNIILKYNSNINIDIFNYNNNDTLFNNYDIIFINITKLNKKLNDIIFNIKKYKNKQLYTLNNSKNNNIFIIGISTTKNLTKKYIDKIYKLGIELILYSPIKKKDIKILFDIIYKTNN